MKGRPEVETTADLYVNRVLELLPRATPRREQIATELRGHIAERTAAGLPIEQVLHQLGDPVVLAESYLSAVPLVSATFGQRAVAKIIDAVLAIVVMVPVIVVTWEVAETYLPFSILFAIVGASFLFAGYTIVAEAEVGYTLGKYVMGLRVVRESGTPISMGQSVVRQLPLFFEFWWIDVLFALFTERSQRAFELLSKTRVVRV
jgi:uncharacterized RDD family membrane protein YckC